MTSRRPLLALVLVLGLSGCGPFGGGDEDAVKDAVSRLASQFEVRELKPSTFSDPSLAANANELVKPLDYPSQLTSGNITTSGDTATATLHWVIALNGHDWSHDTKVSLVKRGDAWKVVWKPSIVESSLKDAEKLVVSGIKATRGDILGADDKPLVTSRPVIRFGIDKTQVPAAAAAASAKRLAAVLDVSAAPLVKQVAAAGPKAFVEALVLRRSEVPSSQLDRVAAIRGARSISDHRPLAPSKDFAAALLGVVGPATAEVIKKSDGAVRAGDDTGLSGLQLRYNDQLAGSSGIKVSAQHVVEEVSDLNEDTTPRVLFSAEPVAGEPLRLTLDLALQERAQRLLDRYGPASALVAIKPSTGEILAAASGPGSKGYNTATFGQYAPGSTFKIVSSLALLRSGLKPTSTVPCPASVSVNGKKFKNYSDYPSNRLGTITLTQAVANSCNTAFISERSKVKGAALAEAAAALGFGVDHDTGFPTYFGQVPAASGETEAAADLIGQGKVLASPMAMATVLASVVKGSTVLPSLVTSVKPEQKQPAQPLTAAEARSLRALLRAVVTEGSGVRLQSLGANPPVIAKTGTAEFGTKVPLQTHTWMVGAQGDLAVAVFVDVGQSGSQTAGPVLEAFLRSAG